MPKKKPPASRRRAAIGADPLDALLASPPARPARLATPENLRSLRASLDAHLAANRQSSATPRAEAPSSGSSPASSPPARARVRGTFHLDLELFEQTRDAVVFLAGPPAHLTLARLLEDALRAELARLAKKHNNGEPFPSRKVPVRTGRPIKV